MCSVASFASDPCRMWANQVVNVKRRELQMYIGARYWYEDDRRLRPCACLQRVLFLGWAGEGVVDVVLNDGGRRKGSCDRTFGSSSPSDCEHAHTYKASKHSSSGRVCKQKFFSQASFDFLARRFLDFAPPTSTRQHAGDGLRGNQEHPAGGERNGRADRAIGGLSCESCNGRKDILVDTACYSRSAWGARRLAKLPSSTICYHLKLKTPAVANDDDGDSLRPTCLPFLPTSPRLVTLIDATVAL
ncbi:hypothetical protein EV421DRAFT_1743719 [Armillaria borealis]|uniref:Uncharacterized protein n=1 Tax=Armillaria borealis TaxID=47425 RepID=A0AA39MEE5_9AGAR|nr:hypothetical protein EV421DRAFT_1743719 [Armillaria borealis]